MHCIFDLFIKECITVAVLWPHAHAQSRAKQSVSQLVIIGHAHLS